MKKDKSRHTTIKRTFFFALFALSAIFFAFYRGDFFSFEIPTSVALVKPAQAVVDDDGNIYIVDSSRSRILRVNTSHNVDMIFNASGGRFTEITDLAVDASRNLYVLNTLYHGSRRVESEMIQKYSPSGKFLEEIYRVDHDIPVFERSIAQMLTDAAGNFFFVTLESDLFILHPEDGSEKIYAYPAARNMLMRFTLNKDGSVLFLTKRGELYEAGQNGHVPIYRPSPPADGESAVVPWGLSAGPDDVYVTDLGNRRICALRDGKLVTVFSGGGDRLERDIYYNVWARKAIVAVSENAVTILDGGDGAEKMTLFPASSRVIFMRLLTWLACGLLVLFLAYCVAALLLFVVRKNSFVAKFSTAVILGVIFVTAIFYLIVMKDISRRITGEMLNRFTTVGQLASRIIPKEAFVGLDSMDDYMGDDYQLVKNTIRNIFFNEADIENENAYCVLYKVLDGAIAEVYTSDGPGVVNYPYSWVFEGSDEQHILETGEAKSYVFSSWVDGGVLFALCSINGEDGEPLGIIEVGTDLKSFQKDNSRLLTEIFLSIISVSVVIIMVSMEFLVFINARRKMNTLMTGGEGLGIPADLTRTAVFLVFFSTNMSTGFLPIYACDMIRQSGGMLGLSTEFLMAVPISADVLFGAVAALFGNFICRRLKIKYSAISAALLFIIGLGLQFAAANISVLSAGSAINGFGAGWMLYIINLSLASEKDDSEKDRGFAGFTVAMTSGINSGVVFGAFLLNWLSNRAVIGVAAFTGLLLLLCAERYISRISMSSLHRGTGKAAMGTLSFITSPRIFIFFAALLIPIIASGYFLIYMFPIVGFDLGISESNIGYSFLLNSLVVIVFGPILTKFFSEKFGKPLSLAIWGAIYASAFVMFAVLQNIPSLLAALILLGFADSFGQSLYTSYFTSQPQTADYGFGRAIGICNIAENIAQTIGPFVFCYALQIGLQKGLILLASALVILTFIFLANAFTRKHGMGATAKN
jgi:predicted MFS family arabinose efflux permease